MNQTQTTYPIEYRDTVASVCTKSSCDSDRSSSVKEIKKNKTSREIRNYQTIQQAVLIAVINHYADITFKQPAKKSITTQQYMRIKAITFSPDNVISFADFLKRRCFEHYNYDVKQGVALKTAKRRYQTNKKTDGLHLLMDLLTELGFQFRTKLTEGKCGTIKLENILEIIKETTVIVGKKELEQLGQKINNILSSRMNNSGKEMTLYRNDVELSSLVVC